jgi:TatD DNase family protein
MNLPKQGDYIDIHTHGGRSAEGVFLIENLMAHEDVTPGDLPGDACSYGIHPWYLNEDNYNELLNKVSSVKGSKNLLAIGECGFDKLKGPSIELQKRAFEEQISISEKTGKPVVIHCVRAWDELLAAKKKMKPEMPWLIHGFRGNAEQAKQLTVKGMYLSFWFDFVVRPESAELLRSVPSRRIFLETDGADVDIREIYNKVALDLKVSVEQLQNIILNNFNEFFFSKDI